MSSATALALAAGAAVLFGLSAVLQRLGARDVVGDVGVGPRLLVRLLARPAFTAGTVLDVVGLTASILAARALPLLVVEAVLALSVGVAALLSSLVLGEPLGRRRWTALAALGAALLVVAVCAETDPAEPVRHAGRAMPFVGLVLAAGAARAARRLAPRWAALVMGLLSGASFGMVPMSGRVLAAPTAPFGPADVLFVATIAGWAALGLVLFGAAVRQSETVTVVAGQVLGETLLPTILGLAIGGAWSRRPEPVLVLAVFAAIVCAVVIVAPADPQGSRASRRRSASLRPATARG